MANIEWGKVVGIHGVRGELKVQPWVDFPSLLPKVRALYLDGVPYEPVGCRKHKNVVLLTLRTVDDRNKADALRDKTITTPREDIDLGEGHYFYSDLYGFDVFDRRLDRVIGVLDRVESFPGGDVYVVRYEGREVMIPIVPAFDGGVSLEDRTVTVTTIEGMLEDDED